MANVSAKTKPGGIFFFFRGSAYGVSIFLIPEGASQITRLVWIFWTAKLNMPRVRVISIMSIVENWYRALCFGLAR